MRESRPFAERTRVKQSDEVARKYFLVYEGEETEVIYFDAVKNLKNDIGINPVIELIPLLRSYSEEGWSNPKKLLDRVICNLEECRTGCISYETLLNRVMEYFYEEKIITTSKEQEKSIWKTLVWICEVKLHRSLSERVEDIESECRTIIDLLKEESDMVVAVNDISQIIKSAGITYSEGFDKICLIVDRDKGSFHARPENNQYEYVLNKCEEKNFGFYITNPCFEFWLLLHFDEVHELNKSKLLKNKGRSKYKYTEQELRRIFPRYHKSSYNSEELVKNIDKAIINEKQFCEDTKLLENTVGSNVGLLIEEMKREVILK